MITSRDVISGIAIKRLRGIEHGELKGLTGLSVLVGPNGCGKSTVLDALMIGAGQQPGDAAGQAVRRRAGTRFGLRWLFWRDGNDGPIEIETHGIEHSALWLSRRGNELQIGRPEGGAEWRADVHGADNRYHAHGKARPVPPVRLIESFAGAERIPLPKVFTEAKEAGRAAVVGEMLAALLPGFGGLEILSDEDNMAVLRMHVGGSPLPVSVAGEGIAALVRTILELSVCAADGTALLEEPEVHQHPRSISLIAQGICESVKRGVQVILTTHSLELIKYLLFHGNEAGILDRTSLHMMRLDAGRLVVARHDGEMAHLRIQEVGEDLR